MRDEKVSVDKTLPSVEGGSGGVRAKMTGTGGKDAFWSAALLEDDMSLPF